MRKNNVFLFNNKKSEAFSIGMIASFVIVFLLLTFVLPMFVGTKTIAEASVGQKILQAQFKKCQLAYDEIKEQGRVMKELDVDGDKCADPLDICIAEGSGKDWDLDGIPDPCDFLPKSYTNTEDNKKYKQRKLCKLIGGNYWDEGEGVCCSPDYKNGNEKKGIKKATICEDAE